VKDPLETTLLEFVGVDSAVSDLESFDVIFAIKQRWANLEKERLRIEVLLAAKLPSECFEPLFLHIHANIMDFCPTSTTFDSFQEELSDAVVQITDHLFEAGISAGRDLQVTANVGFELGPDEANLLKACQKTNTFKREGLSE
jgi:hypothetical protein